MPKFIKIPDGIIREDLIKKVTKYERDKYEGGTYYGVKIETEDSSYCYEEFGRNYYFGHDGEGQARKIRDEKYDAIIEQLKEE